LIEATTLEASAAKQRGNGGVADQFDKPRESRPRVFRILPFTEVAASLLGILGAGTHF